MLVEISNKERGFGHASLIGMGRYFGDVFFTALMAYSLSIYIYIYIFMQDVEGDSMLSCQRGLVQLVRLEHFAQKA